MKQSFSTDSSLTGSVTTRLNHAKDSLCNDGRDAVSLATELAAGQAVLAVLRAFVVPAKTSLVDKLTGKGHYIKKVVNSAYGSLAIASVAHVAVSVFAPSNQKLHRMTQLALNAAMAEAAAHIPLQSYVDKLADKLFNNDAVKAVMGTVTDKAD